MQERGQVVLYVVAQALADGGAARGRVGPGDVQVLRQQAGGAGQSAAAQGAQGLAQKDRAGQQ